MLILALGALQLGWVPPPWPASLAEHGVDLDDAVQDPHAGGKLLGLVFEVLQGCPCHFRLPLLVDRWRAGCNAFCNSAVRTSGTVPLHELVLGAAAAGRSLHCGACCNQPLPLYQRADASHHHVGSQAARPEAKHQAD